MRRPLEPIRRTLISSCADWATWSARMTRECTRSAHRAIAPNPPAPPNQSQRAFRSARGSPWSTNGCTVTVATQESQMVHVVKLPAVTINVL
jgi:hypothetical protein